MLDHWAQISIPATAGRGPVFVITVVSYSLAYDATDVMDNNNVVTALESQIQISAVLTGMVRKQSVEPIVLAKRWGITPEKAQKTIQATTQRGIRTMLYTSLSRRFRINDQNLCYHCLAHPVFSDMMFANKVSRRGNRCAQVYGKDFEWARAFPMASRREAHEILSLLSARYWVPPACLCNSAKEMKQGKFYQKLKEVAWHLKQLEPYTLWSNAADREIK